MILVDLLFIYFDIILGICEIRVVIFIDGVNFFYCNIILSFDNIMKFEIICFKVCELIFFGGGE